MLKINKSNNGITLVALVVTIIILLILATISIQSLTNTGLFSKAKEARDKTANAAENQAKILNEYEDELNKYVSDNKNKTDWTGKVNKPKLMTGMTAIKFNEPVGDEKAKEGSTVKTTDTDNNWYDYDAKKWANAQTQDGSMWVWIPRFAYRVNNSTKTFDVVFLKDTTNTYLDNGTEKDAEKEGYIVHPAFKNESSTGYENGGWDKELTGIWVSKFEAGYASGNNTATVKESSVKYTQASGLAAATEIGSSSDGWAAARNYLDGEYGVKSGDTYTFKNGTAPSIKYPTFQGLASIFFAFSEIITLYFSYSIFYTPEIISSRYLSNSSIVYPLFPAILSSSTERSCSRKSNIFFLRLNVSISITTKSPSPFLVRYTGS